MSEGISQQELSEAIARIANSHDGELLYLWLQKALMAVPTQHVDDGGLREFNGRRMLVAELIALMSEGIRLSGRSDDIRPIVFRLAGSERAESRTRFPGAGRRVSLSTPVSGYDAEPDAADRHPSQPDP